MLKKSKNNASYADDSKEKVSTLIGQGTTFDGDLASSDTIRIDGIINGNCSCEKKLILSSEGQVKGNITAQSVIISGRVDGDITVQGKLELLSTGKIAGNIVAGSIVIDEGASFDGRCTMSSTVSNNTGSYFNAGSDIKPETKPEIKTETAESATETTTDNVTESASVSGYGKGAESDV